MTAGRLVEAGRKRGLGRGFALVGVLLAVALAGMGLSLGARLEAERRQRDREMELLSIGRQYREAIRSYHEVAVGDLPDQWPVSVEDLLEDRRRSGRPARHLRKPFLDPMTNQAWELIKVGDRIVGVRSSSMLEPRQAVGFEGIEQNFNGATRYMDWTFVVQDAFLR